MQIPIQNIYYLLCYAWDKLDEAAVLHVDSEDSPDLANLMARVLAGGVAHLLKRGLDRSYVEKREKTSRLRGRIEFRTLARSGSVVAALPCEFDELSRDVLHNQILRTTLENLLVSKELSRRNMETLHALLRSLTDVSKIEIETQMFGKVQLHRNNHIYALLMNACLMVHLNLLPSDHTGRRRFRDFSRDRRQMARLYEAFVRNFYRHHSSYKVSSEILEWNWIADDNESAALLPRMRTDVSLAGNGRRIVIDCKYTPEATQHYFEATTLRSAHLYQIYAYLQSLPDTGVPCEMMLLYPTVGEPVSASYKYNEHRIRIRTLNLNQPWRSIHSELLALVA